MPSSAVIIGVVILAILLICIMVAFKRRYHQDLAVARELWMDHIIWTRGYIISDVENLPDKDATAARLMKNQDDLGKFYGSDQLTALLKDHIKIAGDVISAAKQNDKGALADAQKKWNDNAESIAQFLVGPTGLPICVLRKMMQMHLDTTTNEVVARINKKFTDDIQAFEIVKKHILMMADGLTFSIYRKQHPLMSRLLVD